MFVFVVDRFLANPRVWWAYFWIFRCTCSYFLAYPRVFLLVFKVCQVFGQFVCAGEWVLTVFSSTIWRRGSDSVRTYMGFKSCYVFGCNFCVQAYGFK